MQTELLKKLHHEGHCVEQSCPHCHHNQRGDLHKGQLLCGKLGTESRPETSGAPASIEGTAETHSPLGVAPGLRKKPHSASLQHEGGQTIRQGL